MATITENKALYTARTHTTGGRSGQSRSSDGRLDVKLSVPGTYTPATLTHKPPQGNNAKCGTACHMIAKGKDYVFTEYAKR